MMIDWRDADSVALLLMRNYPDVDPSDLELPQLSQMILALPGAHDRQGALDEEMLEAIQEAWNEEFEGDRA